jgi:hypothetical protein
MWWRAMHEDAGYLTPDQAWRRARTRAGRPVNALSPLTTRPSSTRASIYSCLLTAPHEQWTVRDIADGIGYPQHLTTNTIRDTIYVLIQDQVLEQLPFHATLTVRLTAEGTTLLRSLLWMWARDRP